MMLCCDLNVGNKVESNERVVEGKNTEVDSIR